MASRTRRTARNVFNSIRGHSLSGRIVDQVIEALFARKLDPGQFLGTEAQLVKMFETSRVPIREALGRLEALGAVTIKSGAGGGVSIAAGEPDQFATALAVQFTLMRVAPSELFDARIAIECRGAELAAEHITREEIAQLQALLKEIVEGHIGRAATERILRFHSLIVEASRSRTLMTLMHGLEHVLLNLYIEMHPEQTVAPAHGYSSLTRILDSLIDHDPRASYEAMHSHLLFQRQQAMTKMGGR
jgi:GntR family transcriptional repressor for pyruvate dehydrogenase complex